MFTCSRESGEEGLVGSLPVLFVSACHVSVTRLFVTGKNEEQYANVDPDLT